jgi:WD40 repeat protein
MPLNFTRVLIYPALVALMSLGAISAGLRQLRGAELPGENTLPGAVAKSRRLPNEAALPQGFLTVARAAAPAASQVAARQSPGERSLPKAGATAPRAKPMPGENELPAPQKQAGDAPRADQAAGEPEGPDDRPWLRFDLQGHLNTIRALTFTSEGTRLCSAGEDKSVHVWTPAPRAAQGSAWMHERTIRWQVERGPLGRIYALAASPRLLAIAGHGAMGGMGEIVLADPATGEFQRVLIDAERGHRQVVASLAFSPDANQPALVSQDLQGQVMLWRRNPQTGLWSGKRLTEPDSIRYAEFGPQTLKRLERNRNFAAVVMSGPRTAISPVLTGEQANGSAPVLQWKLERMDGETGARRLLADDAHLGQVTALAVSRDGTRLASADAAQRLFVWSLADGSRPVRLSLAAPVLSLAFSDSGRNLLVGTAPSSALEGRASLQIWDVSDARRPQKRKEYLVAKPVYACGFRPDGRFFAYTQGAEVRVQPWSDLTAAAIALQAPLRRPRRVAFHRQNYHIALGFEGSSGATPRWEQTFDTDRVELGKANQIDPRAWRSSDEGRGDWTIERLADGTSWLYRAGRRAAQLPLKPEFNENVASTCWIPDAAGQPFAVAVGTGGRNMLYVIRLAEQGVAPILRQFRGHDSTVTSVSLSHDRRYLASCSDDATVRFWSLEGFDREGGLFNRWGARFDIVDNQLTATAVDENGALYLRGLRPGDALTALRWIDADAAEPQAERPAAAPEQAAAVRRSENAPEAMLAALQEVPWDTLLLFEFTRGKTVPPAFQTFPAWRETVSLFLAANREWAYWTPAGFYDASFEGHKLFGWQVNRGVDRRPDFFLAAQFRRALERPQAIEKLLQAGSLEAAFKQAAAPPPANLQDAVVQQHRVAPRITILSPQPGQTVRGASQRIEATITVREGLELAPPKAFANGVVAVRRRLVAERMVGGQHEYRYEWDAPLPRDERLLIQVAAATDALSAATESVAVTRADADGSPQSAPRRRLFLFAAGVNNYRDPQIQRLDYAVNNATHLAEVVKRAAAPLYETEVVSLLDDRVTPAMWRFVTANYVERLKDEVSPDDVLVVFLSGHGLRDADSNEYYYVTAGARLADMMARRYGDCLSFEDLAVFADIPCRKLVVLDTCHSGAVQPLDQHDLKTAVRALQEDLAITLTASDGSQEAVEVKEQKHGRFTYFLLQGLSGAADQHAGDGDHVVTFRELAGYVQRQVQEASLQDAFRQFPTVGPAEVLPYIELPLSQPLQGE